MKTNHLIFLVQYYFIGAEKKHQHQPHGNNKKQESFKRTKETTKEKIKGLCKEIKTNKDIYNTVIEDQGGLENVKTGFEKASQISKPTVRQNLTR